MSLTRIPLHLFSFTLYESRVKQFETLSPLIFKPLDAREEQKFSLTTCGKNSPNLVSPRLLRCVIVICCSLSQTFHFATFSKYSVAIFVLRSCAVFLWRGMKMCAVSLCAFVYGPLSLITLTNCLFIVLV